MFNFYFCLQGFLALDLSACSQAVFSNTQFLLACVGPNRYFVDFIQDPPKLSKMLSRRPKMPQNGPKMLSRCPEML